MERTPRTVATHAKSCRRYRDTALPWWLPSTQPEAKLRDVLLQLGSQMRPSLERRHFALAAAFGVLASGAGAQQPAAPNPAGIEVGVAAPDFALSGATRYGALREPVRLSDHRGETVVIAFFYKARTGG
jgi:hypothetical protein